MTSNAALKLNHPKWPCFIAADWNDADLFDRLLSVRLVGDGQSRTVLKNLWKR